MNVFEKLGIVIFALVMLALWPITLALLSFSVCVALLVIPVALIAYRPKERLG